MPFKGLGIFIEPQHQSLEQAVRGEGKAPRERLIERDTQGVLVRPGVHDLSTEVMDFLRDWLINHLGREDRAMAAHLRGLPSGSWMDGN